MHVQVLYLDGCPHREALVSHLGALLDSVDVDADIELVRIEDEHASERARFLASPTVRVGGEDVEPGAADRTDFGLTCRLFATADGLRATPLDEWVLTAVSRGRAS